jgi:hypothetical protein
MTAAVDRWRESVRKSALRAPMKAVLLAMSSYMDRETLGSAYPGPARIASDTGYSERTVKYALKDAVDSKWLRQVYQGGSDKRGRRASIYGGRWPTKHQDRPVQDLHGSAQGISSISQNGQARPVQDLHGSDQGMQVAPVQQLHTTLSSTSPLRAGDKSARPTGYCGNQDKETTIHDFRRYVHNLINIDNKKCSDALKFSDDRGYWKANADKNRIYDATDLFTDAYDRHFNNESLTTEDRLKELMLKAQAELEPL